MTNLKRRYFLLGSLAAAPRLRAAPARKVLVLLVDGFGPAYLERSEMPNLRRLAKAGYLANVKAQMPTLTNVNNSSVLTGVAPARHGITANFGYDRRTGYRGEMDRRELLLEKPLLEKARVRGWKTAIVSAKEKVRSLCGGGATIEVSAEKPNAADLERGGPAASIYSIEGNLWCFAVARHLLKKEGVDLVYLSTTDYMMHTYAETEEPSLKHLAALDQALGNLIDDHPKLEFYLTADHGMNAKTEAVDVCRALRQKGIEAKAIPIISDKHKVHHNDMGGSVYVYLESPAQSKRAADVVREVRGVDAVYEAKDAISRFELHPDRVGELFVLGSKETVFSDLESDRKDVKLRSHGSLHEDEVPLVISGKKITRRLTRSRELTQDLDLSRR